MKTSSAKAKGRRLQDLIRDGVRRTFIHLTEHDVSSAIMGDTGIDLKLSSAARTSFPFAVEARNREKVNIWKTIEDAERHAKKEKLLPLGVFTRNHMKEPYVLLRWSIFIKMMRLLGIACVDTRRALMED